MNIKEYISSGVLEAYVLGELSQDERDEVEKNLSRFQELREELLRIEETQEKLLLATGIEPRSAVKTKIFEKLESEHSAIAINSPTLGFWRLAAAASIVIALVSSYLAYNYWNKWRSTESSLRDLIAQNQRIAQDYNQVNNRLDQIEKEIQVLDNPDFKKIVMTGTPNAPASRASVYWNENSRELYLTIQSMKELTADNQYQLWAIIDGKPVDAGVFDWNNSGLIRMKDIGKGASTFAVTIEPRGGKSSPTIQTMQVAANVVKS